MTDARQSDDILVQRPETGIAVVTLNRPGRLNALTREMVASLNRTLDMLAEDSTCRAVVLTGAGRGFCSGQDIAAAAARTEGQSSGVVEKLYWQEQFVGMGARIRSMPQVVIAAVNGPAAGAGMAIALSADVRIVAPMAKFLVASVRIGLTAGESGMSYLLPRLIGGARAFDIMLTGRAVAAEEAERIGLAVRIADPAALLEDAVDYARAVLANSPYAVTHSKRLLWDNLDASSCAAATAAENKAQILGTMTRDYGEALAAFLEKREPRFDGR